MTSTPSPINCDARIDTLLAETGAERLTLATHSMGGLVARAYLRRYGDAKVAALMTLAAPHHGSMLARLAIGRNARQMEPDSAWLRELAAAKIAIPVVAVWSVTDEFVAPQDSARWPGACEHVLRTRSMSMAFSDQSRRSSAMRRLKRAPALEVQSVQQLGEGDLIRGRTRRWRLWRRLSRGTSGSSCS